MNDSLPAGTFFLEYPWIGRLFLLKNLEIEEFGEVWDNVVLDSVEGSRKSDSSNEEDDEEEVGRCCRDVNDLAR